MTRTREQFLKCMLAYVFSLRHFVFVLFGFVVLDSVYSVLAQRLALRTVSEITYFALSGT